MNSTDPPSLLVTTPVVTAPVFTPDVDVTPPNTTDRTTNVTPPVQETPQRDTVIDPRVVALRALFPDYDDLILISVLESVGGNQDRAIDTLLVMSDPEYKGEPPAAVQSEQPALSQTELDEQFARHLMLEEQQQRQQQWVNANQQPPATYQSHPSQQRWNSQAQPGEGGAVATNSAGDFQEQFSKIAESGRKTIGSLFSKVKAKIQEFDQSRSTGQTSGSSTQAQPAVATQPSYFDPNSHSSLSAPGIDHQSSPAATPVSKGYDLSPSHSITPPDTPEPLPPMNNSAPLSSNIEAGKLGLLPKRPVSLLRDPATTSSSPPGASELQPSRQLSQDDDDGLEYTENPFEETEKQR